MKEYLAPVEHLDVAGLPERGHLFVFGTVGIWSPEDIAHGDTDRKGWVSRIDDRDEPAENRNDVTPLFAGTLPLGEEQIDDLTDMFRRMGAVHDSGNNDGTLYLIDPVEYDLTSGDQWMYAVHAVVKDFNATESKWTETSVNLLK